MIMRFKLNEFCYVILCYDSTEKSIFRSFFFFFLDNLFTHYSSNSIKFSFFVNFLQLLVLLFS